jgi:hypothetical protein
MGIAICYVSYNTLLFKKQEVTIQKVNTIVENGSERGENTGEIIFVRDGYNMFCDEARKNGMLSESEACHVC